MPDPSVSAWWAWDMSDLVAGEPTRPIGSPSREPALRACPQETAGAQYGIWDPRLRLGLRVDPHAHPRHLASLGVCDHRQRVAVPALDVPAVHTRRTARDDEAVAAVEAGERLGRRLTHGDDLGGTQLGQRHE